MSQYAKAILMAEPITPGVRIEELPGPPAIEGRAMNTTAFLGLTGSGPAKPALVRGWREYTERFGGLRGDPKALTPYAIRGFFENGGRRAVVVPIASLDERAFRTALEQVEEYAEETHLIAAPECPPGLDFDTQAMLAEYCGKERDRLAILAGPRDALPECAGPLAGNSWAAMYSPWVRVPMEGPIRYRPSSSLLIPPVGHIAGIYARVEERRGLHHAPANEAIHGLATPNPLAVPVTQADSERLNPLGINLLRDFRAQGKGVLVWGARTLALDPEWKYVPVRRLALYIEQSVFEGCEWAVWEPNEPQLWSRLRLAVSNFLFDLWKRGSLMGTRPEEAYSVVCDESTMTQDDIDAGRIVMQVGFAALRPAEFIVLRIGWKSQGEAA